MVERIDDRLPEVQFHFKYVVAIMYRHVLVNDFRRQLDRDGRRRVRVRGRIEDQRRRIAAYVNRIVARTADDRRAELFTGAEDEYLVRSAAAVDLDGLDARKGRNSTGAGNQGVGHHEDVANRRADHHDRIDSRSAVDEHRGVLQVIVPIGARTAEDAREVRHLVGIVAILAEHEECLEQEPVVPGATVQEQFRAVMVDLEAVVLAAAKHEQRRRITVGHILGIGHRNAVGELEVAVARIGNQRDRADGDFIVAAAHIDDRYGHRVVGKDAVGTTERVDLHTLDTPISDLVAEVRPVDRVGADVHESGPHRSAALCVKGDSVRPVGTEHEKLIEALACAGVADVHPALIAAGDVQDVELAERVLGVAQVVERYNAGPVVNEPVGVTDVDNTVAIADHHNVLAVAAFENSLFEDTLNVLDRRPGGEMVAGVTEREVRIVEFDVLFELGLIGRSRSHQRTAAVADDRSDDERTVEESHVGVSRLREDIVVVIGVDPGFACIEERVETRASGYPVAAETAVDNIVERRADQRIVAHIAHDLQGDQIDRFDGHLGGVAAVGTGDGDCLRCAKGAGVDPVISVAGMDDNLVVFAANSLAYDRGVVCGRLPRHAPSDPYFAVFACLDIRLIRREDEFVVATGRYQDLESIGRTVIDGPQQRNGNIVDLVGSVRIVIVIDRFLNLCRADDADLLAEVDFDVLQARPFEFVECRMVAAEAGEQDQAVGIVARD